MLDAWLNARLDDADPNSTMAPPYVMATTAIDVPEPSGRLMLGSGLLFLLALGRRRARA